MCTIKFFVQMQKLWPSANWHIHFLCFFCQKLLNCASFIDQLFRKLQLFVDNFELTGNFSSKFEVLCSGWYARMRIGHRLSQKIKNLPGKLQFSPPVPKTLLKRLFRIFFWVWGCITTQTHHMAATCLKMWENVRVSRNFLVFHSNSHAHLSCENSR